MKLRETDAPVVAAAKASISATTAYRLEHGHRPPSHKSRTRDRRRPDPDRVPLRGVTAACRSSVSLVGRADQITIAGNPMAGSSLMPAMVSRVMYRPR